MISALDYYRELNIEAVIFKLLVAMFFGGALGINRLRKRRAAGFRTYIIVCVGAALAVILGQYEFVMIQSHWRDIAANIGIKTDVSRFGAQVINGIGFLATGTVIVTGRQQIKGLTTAAGLWLSACTGLAIGAGFYEMALGVFIAVIIMQYFLSPLDMWLMDRNRNVNIFVEFKHVNDLGDVISAIKQMGVTIYSVDIEYADNRSKMFPSASFALRLPKGMMHTTILSEVASIKNVQNTYEN